MDSLVRISAIIQARLSSMRLPAKVMKDLCGRPVIERVIDQVRKSEVVSDVWISTSNESEDDLLELIGSKLGISVYRGSLTNVLERYYETIRVSGADIIVRVTADNPYTETSFIDCGVKHLISKGLDYVSYEKIPYGTGVEIFTSKALEQTYFSTNNEYDREHVTPFIIRNSDLFKLGFLTPRNKKLERPDLRFTIDNMEDYENIYKLTYAMERDGVEPTLLNLIHYYDYNKGIN